MRRVGNKLWVLALLSIGVHFPVFALNCPPAELAAEKATKEGIGAQWDENQVKWYLDYFSNAKPDELSLKKFTFLQALYENQQLTCYYGWPGADGRTTSWMTVRLKTTQGVTPKWQGQVCQNFMAEKCEFDLSPVEATTTTPTPEGTTPTSPYTTPVTTPKSTTEQTPTTEAMPTPGGAMPTAPGATPSPSPNDPKSAP